MCASLALRRDILSVRLKFKWNKFYVCDRVAWLIEEERTAQCGVSVE